VPIVGRRTFRSRGMGAGVAFQAPVIMRSTMQAPRAPSGAPTKPVITVNTKPVTISLPGAPKLTIPVPVMPKPVVTGTRTQAPTPAAPPALPPTYVNYQIPPSSGPVLTGPISGPGITDTTGAPPAPPPVTVDNSGGGGGGPVSVPTAAQPFPWLMILAIAGGLYLVTR
jgi:hypothetical protein